MAPKKGKQSLLPLEKWIPHPTHKTALKHNKLVEKVYPKKKSTKDCRSGCSSKSEIGKKNEERDRKGAEKWAEWYQSKEITGCINPLASFQAFGDPPNDTILSSKDMTKQDPTVTDCHTQYSFLSSDDED